MRPYLATMDARFRTLLQYRAAAMAGVVTQFFWGIIRLMILGAFFATSPADSPMTLPQIVAYVWLGQALLGMLPWNVDGDLRTMIRQGTIASELTRPVDLYWTWYVRAIAQRCAPTLLRFVPIVVFAGFVVRWIGLDEWALMPPASWSAALAFILAVIAALFLSAAITTVLNISMLWSLGGEGVNILVFAGAILFSGLIVPLPMFPEWMQVILRLSPFAGLADLPFRVYSGHLPMSELWQVLTLQFIWTAVIIALGRWLLATGVRRLVIQGG